MSYLGRRKRVYAPGPFVPFKRARMGRSPLYMAPKGSSTARNPLNRSGFPSTKLVRIRYADSFTLTGTSGAVAQKQFRANGAYDPDASVGGHQPLSWDQWSAMYGEYTVLGAKMTLSCVPDSGQTVPSVVSVYTTGTTTAATDWQSSAEQPGGQHLMMGPSTGLSTRHLVHKFSTKRWFGVKHPHNNADLSANHGSNPSAQAYFNIQLQSADGSTTAAADCNVLIEYIVLFTRPRSLTAS